MQIADYSILEFSEKGGCKKYKDIQNIQGLSPAVKEIGIQVIELEINKKIRKFSVYRCVFLFLVLGILTIILCFVLARYLKGFTILVMMFGVFLLIVFCVLVSRGNHRIKKLLENARTKMYKLTNGELMCVPVWKENGSYVVHNRRGRRRASKICKYLLIKKKNSLMTPQMVLRNTNPQIQQHYNLVILRNQYSHPPLHQIQTNNAQESFKLATQLAVNSNNQLAIGQTPNLYAMNQVQSGRRDRHTHAGNDINFPDQPLNIERAEEFPRHVVSPNNLDQTASILNLDDSNPHNNNNPNAQARSQHNRMIDQNINPGLRPHSLNMQMMQFQNMIPQQHRTMYSQDNVPQNQNSKVQI